MRHHLLGTWHNSTTHDMSKATDLIGTSCINRSRVVRHGSNALPTRNKTKRQTAIVYVSCGSCCVVVWSLVCLGDQSSLPKLEYLRQSDMQLHRSNALGNNNQQHHPVPTGRLAAPPTSPRTGAQIVDATDAILSENSGTNADFYS